MTTALKKWIWMLLAVAVFVVTMTILYARYFPDLKLSDTVPATVRKAPAQDSKAENTEKKASVPTIRDQEAIADKSDARAPSRIDQAVVGQPFQISASLKEGCKSDTVECPLVMASVARMVNEPRDIDWAIKMEEKIQSAVDKQRPGRYVIRNLECRTTTCILEVESHDGSFVARYDGAITSSLRPNGLTIGVSEYDSSGASYRLELMDFERR